MVELTAIRFPHSVPFPVTITSILCKVGESIPKYKTILVYKYWDYQEDPQAPNEDAPKKRVERFGTFENPVEGELCELKVAEDDEILHSGIDLFLIKEQCFHTVQYGGLCALCGRSLEEFNDYTDYNIKDRATITMSHNNCDLRISFEEATKIEQSIKEKLLKDRKLILVVDLDQTVIHATVDPIVNVWKQDVKNANNIHIKDIKSFCLDEMTNNNLRGNKVDESVNKVCYHVKLRPGLYEFLEEISKLYQMHIYTMATRSYALEIAKLIDPESKFFGDRILSRDESGSITQKNLKRLFPVDQSMVAIIDDRGDVWNWEDNLIKVVPYNFFVGTGDINYNTEMKKNKITESNYSKNKNFDSNSSINIKNKNLELIDLDDLESKKISEDDFDKKNNDYSLLNKNDSELLSLTVILKKAYTSYYEIFDNAKDNLYLKPDLTQIIPELKKKCLDGIVVLFSGVIPLDKNYESEDIVIWSKQFGIEVVTQITSRITHVVCKNNGPNLTKKAKISRKTIPGVKIVSFDWILACLGSWKKIDVSNYLIQADEKDWFVSDEEINLYNKSLNLDESNKIDLNKNINHHDNLDFKYTYDFDEVDKEVDDFLADTSTDDDNFNPDNSKKNQSNHNKNLDSDFISEKKKRKHLAYKPQVYSLSESDDSLSSLKKKKSDYDNELILEKQLLDSFKDLENI